ncbi:MAG: hydrolase [Verrucomicrobia bacterium]|nr:hydrolase [Verrucomicrobiota bacterium]
METKPRRIARARAGLLVVDVQERLLPAMDDRERLLVDLVRLARGAALLKLPVWITEQYPKGLGATVPQMREALGEVETFEKLTFSAGGATGLMASLAARAVTEVILCGIEAHVCVAQSCLDLLDAGMRVFVVVDAVGSRTAANRAVGIDRMREAGALLVSTEMILFELMEAAGGPDFKELQRLVK